MANRRASTEQLASLFAPVAEQLITPEVHQIKTRLDKVTGGGVKIRADRIQGKVPADVMGLIDDSQITVSPNPASPATNLEDMLLDFAYAIMSLNDGLQLPVGAVPSGHVIDLENLYSMGAMTGQTVSANRLFYMPFFVPHDLNVNAILFNIVTAVTGSVQTAIFDNNPATFQPVNNLALGAKTSYSTTGVKTQSISRLRLEGRTWYWLALCSVTAHALAGTSDNAFIPALRGGVNNLTQKRCMMYQDLTAGWSNIPSTATPSSGPSNFWLKVSAQQGT